MLLLRFARIAWRFFFVRFHELVRQQRQSERAGRTRDGGRVSREINSNINGKSRRGSTSNRRNSSSSSCPLFAVQYDRQTMAPVPFTRVLLSRPFIPHSARCSLIQPVSQSQLGNKQKRLHFRKEKSFSERNDQCYNSRTRREK